MHNRVILVLTLRLLGVLRRVINATPWTYAMLTRPWMQPLLERLQYLQAYAVCHKAQRDCPAYQAFLAAHPHAPPRRARDLAQLPATTKENYVKQYTIEQRCYGGCLPAAGVVIDESSGSSGAPNNWVRGPAERAEVRRNLQIHFGFVFERGPYFLLNCFALGPWATGMNVSMSLVDVGILKSIGPDQAKLENTLRMFGPGYRYILLGYPPFLKSFADSTKVDLRQYTIEAIVGGEGMSEAMRSYLRPFFKRIISSYGASDLEINLGVETELTINLRQRCADDPALAQALFGRTTPPMVFQYNPLDYLIETSPDGELIFTICRPSSVAPKLRYNLHDSGGTLSYRALAAQLRTHGIAIESLARRHSYFPMLFVYGRSDMTVPFYGAKVFPTDLEQIISSHPLLASTINSFQLRSDEDAQLDRRLTIRLERKPHCCDPLDQCQLCEAIFDGLVRCNQDFREVTKMFSRERVGVELFDYGTGPFADQDLRIKRQYIA